MAKMIRETGLIAGRALDIGCGDGRGTYELARMLGEGWEWYGIDISERVIAFARFMAPRNQFEVGDAKSLPYGPDSFDLVVAREVIEHIPPHEVSCVLEEIYRILKPLGKFLLTTPSERRRVPEKHFQHFSAEKLERLLTLGGFKIVYPRTWLVATNMV